VLPALKAKKRSDLLIKVKPRLDDNTPGVRVSLGQDLHRIAFLAESLTEQRSRSKKSLVLVEELLDREGSLFFCYHFRDITFRFRIASSGVLLWNTSGIIGKTPDDDGRAVIAARQYTLRPHLPFLLTASIPKVRLAAFRLIEAGLEQKPGIACLGSPTAVFPV
jgi:hypothetical protein